MAVVPTRSAPSDPRSSRVANSRGARAIVSLAVVIAVAACSQATSENIQLWKTTEKGPDRLHDTLADHGVAPRLRAEAAAALVDIGRSEEVDTVMAKLSPDDRADIAKTLIPLYETGMKDPSLERALTFRDALFSLRQGLTTDDQKRIDQALLAELGSELEAGKLRQGRHSLDKMLTAIGPDGAAMLARVLGADAPYLQAAQLLGKIGDDASRERGGTALVARASQIQSRPEEKRHPESFYKAVGAVGGPSAVKFLESKASGPNKEEALLAIRALGERRDPSVLPFALKVAGDPKADRAARDEMFGVIEAIGGLEAQRGLQAIISSDKDEMVRYRAFESMLAVGKSEALQPALEAFPSGATYKRVDVDDLLVKLIEKLGPPARPALAKTLASRSPLARMTAAMALEQMGTAADAPELEKLTGDRAPVKGFPAGDTVGKQASRAADAVKKRS